MDDSNYENSKCFNEHCAGCKYYSSITSATYYCTYLLQTDRRRPRPPGKGCTVRVEKNRRAEDGK